MNRKVARIFAMSRCENFLNTFHKKIPK